MFRISKEQMEKFSEVGMAAFVTRACEFLRSNVPEPWADTTDAALRAWVDGRVRNARSLGLVEEDSVLAYLEIASVYNEDFAERGDVLVMLADLDLIQDWDYVRSVLDAQFQAGPAQEHDPSEVPAPEDLGSLDP